MDNDSVQPHKKKPDHWHELAFCLAIVITTILLLLWVYPFDKS